MRRCASARAVTMPASRNTLRCWEDSRAAHVEFVGEFAERGFTECKGLDDLAPGRVGKGNESIHGPQY